LADLFEGATCHFRTVPRVTFLLGQITPKKDKNDCHVSTYGVAMCHVDVSVDFDFFCPVLPDLQITITSTYGVHFKKKIYG